MPPNGDQTKQECDAGAMDQSFSYGRWKLSILRHPSKKRDDLESMKTEAMQPNDVPMQTEVTTCVKGDPDSCCKGKENGNHRIANPHYEVRT
ncbi:hypothetical protein P4V54_22120 [Brevibacillus nitrificans]|uniref:hypothetical protein n=1 Tax=Brevibacillus nitrificans TaxID=651560 RepID=UPI002E22798A|nr:hypothetical protein [Brevibacillus nitrificans]